MNRAVLLTVVMLSGCGSPTARREISANELNEKWPLKVNSGTIECLQPSMIFFHHGSTRYALNEAARSRFPGPPEIDKILKPDPQTTALRVNVGPLVNEALRLCK